MPDPGPVKCLIETQTLGTQMRGPECWDPNFWDPSAGTHRPGTRMKGPRYRGPSKGQRSEDTSMYLDLNTVTNVHVSTKSTVGTSEHSFKSVDEGG